MENKTLEYPKYRFLDKEKEHLHQIFSEKDGDYANLTGTTSIIDVLGKPLTWWASGLACEAMGWLRKLDTRKGTPEEVAQNLKDREEKADAFLKSLQGISGKKYLELLDKAYRAHSETLKDKADDGTQLHADLEMVIKVMMTGTKVSGHPNPKVMEFVRWAEENVERFLWSEMNCFSEILWVGGVADFGAFLKDGSVVLGDFKSHKEGYFSDFVQCGGYDIQISENGGYNENGNKVFELEKPIDKYIVFPFGGKILTPTIITNTKGMQSAFLDCVDLYRQKAVFEN